MIIDNTLHSSKNIWFLAFRIKHAWPVNEMKIEDHTLKMVHNIFFGSSVKVTHSSTKNDCFLCKNSFVKESIIPPANEVWGKEIISQVCFLGVGGWLPSMNHRSHDQGSASRGSASRGGGSVFRGVGQTPSPWIHGILWDTVNKRAVRILLERIPVIFSNYFSNDWNMHSFQNVITQSRFCNIITYWYRTKLVNWLCWNSSKLLCIWFVSDNSLDQNNYNIKLHNHFIFSKKSCFDSLGIRTKRIDNVCLNVLAPSCLNLS